MILSQGRHVRLTVSQARMLPPQSISIVGDNWAREAILHSHDFGSSLLPMLFLRRFSPAALLFSALIFSSCSAPAGNSASTNSEANRVASVPKKANDKAEELGLLINFTLEPEDIVWLQVDSPKKIVAVFRLDEEDTKKLIEQLTPRSQGEAKSVMVEDWFPAELVAGGETTDSSTVDGTAYPADDFYQHPFSQGTITRISNTDFFVLEISAV